LSFSKWLWLSALLSISASQLDPLLLNRWVAPALLGMYALALNLSGKFDLLNQTLHIVLLPTVSALTIGLELRAYVRQSLIRSSVLGLGVIAVLPLASPLILFIYGAAYGDAVNVFYLLALVVVFDLITNPLLLLAFPLNMPRALAAADGARVLTLIISASLLVPSLNIYGMALAKLASHVAGALVIGLAMIVRGRVRFRSQTTALDADNAPEQPPAVPR
jgi:O-antigen/teichoic acid export membrane protein